MTTDAPTWDETTALESAPSWDDTTEIIPKSQYPSLEAIQKVGAQTAAQQKMIADYGGDPNQAGTELVSTVAGSAAGAANRAVSKIGELGAPLRHVSDAVELLEQGEPAKALNEFVGAPNTQGQTPYEEQVAQMPAPLRAFEAGKKGLIEATPQMAAVAGGEMVGIPAPLSAAAVFGATPQGFSPKQAAIGALLPEIGKYGGALTEKIASRLGVSGPTASSILNRAGGAGGAAALLGADQLNQIRQLPPDKRGDAYVDAVGNVLSMAWLGMMGEHAPQDRAARVAAGELAKASRQRPTPENLRAYGQPVAPPIIEKGTPSAPFAGIPRRPPETPQAKRNQPVEIPGTAAEPERNLTAIDEIRQAGADTKKKIQALFPERKLSNEEAAQLRNLAFPETKPSTPTENASENQTPAEVHGNLRPPSGQGQGQMPTAQSGAGIQPPVENAPAPQGQVSLMQQLPQHVITAIQNAADPRAAENELRWFIKGNKEVYAAVQADGFAVLDESDLKFLTPQQRAVYDEWVKQGKPESGGKAEPAEKPATNKGAPPLAKPATSRPIPTMDEAHAAKLPMRAKSAITEYDINQKIIETGLHPNGKKANAKYIADLQERQKQVITNFKAASEQPPYEAAPSQSTSGIELARQIAAHPSDKPFKSGFTVEALKAGASLDPTKPEQLEELLRLEAQAKAEYAAVPKDIEHFNQLQTIGLKKQWLTEAIQAATGMEEREEIGKKILGQDYQAPFPGGKPREKTLAPADEAGQKAAGDNVRPQPAPAQPGGVAPSPTLQPATESGANAPALAGVVGAASSPGTPGTPEPMEREGEITGSGAGSSAVGANLPATGQPPDAGTGPASGGGGAGETETGVEKAETQVQKVAAIEGQRPAREVKNELVASLEKAVADAPAKAELPEQQQTALDNVPRLVDASDYADKTTPRYSNENMIKRLRLADAENERRKAEWIKSVEATGLKRITVDIPGDGTFKIWNTKEALSQVLQQAKKIKTGEAGGKPFKEKKPSGGLPNEVKTTTDWDLAKKFFELKGSDTIADRYHGLDELAKSLSHEKALNKPVNEITAGDVDRWIENKIPKSPSGEAHAFGGASAARAPKIPGLLNPKPVSAGNPQQLVTLQNSYTPGLLGGVKSLLLPSSKSPAHLRESERLGSFLGPMHRAAEVANASLKTASTYFDKLGVHRDDLPAAQNPGVQFMSALSTGKPLPSPMDKFADTVEKAFQDRVKQLNDAEAPLETVRKNYFPGMWTRESRLAFNAALDEAIKKGVIQPGADLNNATAQQKAWVKNRTDELLESGQGSDNDMLSYLTRRPLAGRESFRKQKVFEDIMTGAEFGLRPISNNPIDLVKGKLAEMDRSIMAHREFQSLKQAGKMKVISPYEDVPEGWVKVNDKYGTIYGPPTVTVPEYVDKTTFEGLVDFAKSLGIEHERSMSFPPGQGSRALGLSYTGQNFIRSRFGTELSVIAHEIGHQLDERYDLWNNVAGGGKGNARNQMQKELRALADLTGRRKDYTRTPEEKIAQMVEAYVGARELMVKNAPNIFQRFDAYIRGTPELKKLADLYPGLELKKLTGEKYVGLPIVGYRIVPEATGDILNNYLSSSLYNNRYFGGMYRGWMNAANALNQTQLGVGSAFHASFTTSEAQVSAGSNLIKDVYGVARGNRSVSDLAETAKKWTTASIGTALTGDKVLNAWRNPDGVIDPKIKDVVRAAELAGAGFKMERGLQTDQMVKMMRNWYSGQRVRAALRSPVALTELMSKPVMEGIVPRQKAGVFAELANRIIEQNPGKPLEALTPQFRQAWNRVDARLGQVRYDRLFANNTAKNVVQMLVRAPGWTGGTIAEIGGAFPDTAKFLAEWAKTGKAPENIPDRTAYVLSLLVTVGAINAALTYAFTGQKPHGMDFMAFRDGTKDQYGNENRLLLPTYMKDLLAYAVRPGTTLANKAHPALGVINDVLQNRDYYGYEVRDTHAGVATQAAQSAKYVLKSFEPFWTRGVRKANQQGSTVASQVGSYFGVMPAPGYITMSPMQREIGELYHKRTGEPVRPYGSQNAPKKQYDKTTLDIYMFHRLPLSDRQALAAKMTPEEKKRYGAP